MATNIEMNIKQESNYEVIYPQTICDMVINLLNPDTKELMELEPTADADDAFRKIYLAQVLDGRALINFTVMGDDGTPCAGVQIESSQFCDSTGNKVPVIETNDEGKISIFVDNTSVRASISGYADLYNFSTTYSIILGQIYDKQIKLTRRNFLQITESGNIKFSSYVDRISFCVGGGGGSGYYSSSRSSGGTGGSGGQFVEVTNQSINYNQDYTVSIGAGGIGSNSYQVANGGNSSFMGHTGYRNNMGDNPTACQGGRGARYRSEQGVEAETGGNGISGFYSSISNTVYYGAGGGGGGFSGENHNNISNEAICHDGKKGVNGGGDGGTATTRGNVTDGTNGIDGRGCGGGGPGVYSEGNGFGENGRGGNGGSGCVAIRMYRQQDLT